jgi:hypothetical protein
VNWVVTEGRHLLAQGADDPGVVDERLTFFERHSRPMGYVIHRANKCFIGSKVVEAGCRTVVRKRLTQSRMFCRSQTQPESSTPHPPAQLSLRRCQERLPRRRCRPK